MPLVFFNGPLLRDFIAKTCHVYIDDVIVFSPSAREHIIDVENVLKRRNDANMRVSAKKSTFFAKEV